MSFRSDRQRKYLYGFVFKTKGTPPKVDLPKRGKFVRIRVEDPKKFSKIRTIDPGKKGHTKLRVGRIKGQKKTSTQSVMIESGDVDVRKLNGKVQLFPKTESVKRTLVKVKERY